MKIVQEFKEFISRGNMIELAMAVIIGAAFNKIITSLVADVIMPPIGFILGKVDFDNLKIILQAGTETVEEVSIRYGAFIQSTVDFVIIALVVFLLIKSYTKLLKKQQAEKKAEIPTPTAEETLLSEIRDLLKKA